MTEPRTDTHEAPSREQRGEWVYSHVAMLHQLAAGIDGKLTVASYGEDPQTGKEITPKVLHFEIGDVDGMYCAICALSKEPHRNIYSPLW